MLTKLNRSLVVYLLCAAVTFSMGMAALSTNHMEEDSTPDNMQDRSATVPVSEGSDRLNGSAVMEGPIARLPYATPAAVPTASRLSATATAPAERTGQAAAVNRTGEQAAQQLTLQTAAQPAAAKPLPILYEITAYYLNVREEPHKDSSIVSVLEKGMQVHVRDRMDNGWLGLRDGGYIHGSYASRLEQPVVGAAEAASAAKAAIATPKRVQEVAALSASAAAADIEARPAVLKLEKPGSKVETASGLTHDAIAILLEGTELEDHGLEEAILEIEEEYGINAYFTIAVMKLESGNGKSRLARDKNNLFGLNATGGSNSKAYSFETKGDSVHKFGSLISKSYIGKGYTTIEKIAKKYCPPNPKWASLVKNIMNRDHKKLSKGVAV